MARQSIPRFDLYGELGVEPSADEDAIEAAYRALIWRHDPAVAGVDDDARLVRLRVAHLWLADSERRSRYDASRSRAAARGSTGETTSRKPSVRRTKKGAVPAGLTPEEAAEAEAGAAAEAWASANGATDGSWPVADLDRAPKPIVQERRAPRPSRQALAGIGALALLVVVVAGALVIANAMPPAPPAAVATPSAPAPTPTAIVATPSPEPSPTVAVTAPPLTPTPIDFAALQQSAWDTIQALAAAAATGDVATAQTLLGDTAPGLRASGLKRATFPDVEASAISVTQSGASFIAIAGTDQLTSADGTTWTFDYADRPLALYRSPSSEPVHDLWWSESDGKHHVYLRVAFVTVSRSGVTAKVSWTYDPSQPDDATYFRRSELVISSLTLDTTPSPVTATPLPMVGVTTLSPTATFIGVGSVPSSLSIGITVTNPRTAGGNDRAIESIFELEVR